MEEYKLFNYDFPKFVFDYSCGFVVCEYNPERKRFYSLEHWTNLKDADYMCWKNILTDKKRLKDGSVVSINNPYDRLKVFPNLDCPSYLKGDYRFDDTFLYLEKINKLASLEADLSQKDKLKKIDDPRLERDWIVNYLESELNVDVVKILKDYEKIVKYWK